MLIEMEGIIKEELNVKNVVYRENEEELVEFSVKANYRLLGKTLGKDMKTAALRIEKLTIQEIQSLLDGATLSLDLDGRILDLTEESVIIKRCEKENLKVLNEGSLTIALDTELTEELIQEGIIRDLVRGIQNLRKEKGFEVTDRIKLYLFGSDELKKAMDSYNDHLTRETLASSWLWINHESAELLECSDQKCSIYLEKA